MKSINIKQMIKQITLALCICALLASCSSSKDEEPTSSDWVVDYVYRGAMPLNKEKNDDFLNWCKANEKNIILNAPQQRDHDSYLNGCFIYWREYIPDCSEEIAKAKAERFNGFHISGDTRTRYFRHNPNHRGPWTIEVNEYFNKSRNTSQAFKQWFEKYQEFLSSELMDPALGWPECSSYEDYMKFSVGMFEWLIVVNNKTETEIKGMVAEIKNFSTRRNSAGEYDYFQAAYFPYAYE